MARPSKTEAFTPIRRTRSAFLRRPPTGGWPLLRLRIKNGWRWLLEQQWIFIGAFLAAAAWSMLPESAFLLPQVNAGTIASRTWIADRQLQVVDEGATRSLQERAQQDVPPVYDLDRGAEINVRRHLGIFFADGRELLEHGNDRVVVTRELASRLGELGSLKLSEAQIELLRERAFSPELEERLLEVLGRIYKQGAVADKELLLEHRLRGITVRELPSGRTAKSFDLYSYLDYPDQVRQTIEQSVNGWDGVKSRERRVWVELLLANISPNLNFNSSATLELRQRAAAAVGSVTHTFAKGEVIVRNGSEIDELRARALREMGGRRSLWALVQILLGTVLLLGATVFLLWLAIHQERKALAGRGESSPARILSECMILLGLAIATTRVGAFIAQAVGIAIESPTFGSAASYVFAIPFAALSLLAVLLYGRTLALVLSLVFSLCAGPLTGVDTPWTTMVFCLASSLAAVFALDQAQFRQRSVMTRAALVIGAVNALAVLTLRLMSGNVEGGGGRLLFDLGCGFAGGLLAASIASFSVAVFESLFGVTTSIKLIELANPNLPLLRRLAVEAPGTFQHSLAVANLAKAGVEAIDGDSVLVHTGALYHDIGKLFRPQYFVENQLGENPHDRIQPSMSALILINHVKEGVELVEQEGLPAPIRDAIEQHHGSRLIKYFYSRAVERREGGAAEIRDDDYRYPGPKPQSKETGILMLADAIEAASRTLIEPNQQKIRNVVRTVLDDCLADGQLEETDLTLGDLRKVEDAFQRVLSNVHHRRIDYPGLDFNRVAPDRGGAERGSPEQADDAGSSGERSGERAAMSRNRVDRFERRRAG